MKQRGKTGNISMSPLLFKAFVAPLEHLTKQQDKGDRARVMLVPGVITSLAVMLPILLIPASASMCAVFGIIVLATLIGFPAGIFTGLHIDMLYTNLKATIQKFLGR